MRKLLLLALLSAAALAWWIYHSKNEPPEVPFAKVVRETLISMLPTNGKVEPIEWQAVRAEAPGLVESVPVQEGQMIAKGATLANLKSTGLQADLDAAEARVAQARADLATIEAGGKSSELADIDNQLAKARLDRDTAQREYGSLQRLAQKHAATPAEVESARGKLRQSEVQIEGLVRRRAALIGKTDQSVALAKLKEAQAAVALARTRIAETVIRAPMAGTVYNLAVRPGAYLSAGAAVANIGRLERVRVRVYVDEPELGRVAPGQAVTITWQARPGQKWNGTVERMPTEIVTVGTRQVGEVLCTIENPSRELIPGTNIDAEIRTSVAQNARTIPKQALRRDPAGVGVFLLTGDTVTWRKVKTGASNVTRVQVLEGLTEGDSVALPSDHVLHEGERVKPVYP